MGAVLLDVEAHELEPLDLGPAQLDVGEQRAVAAQSALRAQRAWEAWVHGGTMTDWPAQ